MGVQSRGAESGPLGLYDRWPYIHLAIAGIVVAGAALTWPRILEHPSWFWFLVLPIPILVVHEWEEFVFPGGFSQWFNLHVCRSRDPWSPFTRKHAAVQHMPLMIVYPLLAVVGARWPWLGLAGLYALMADGMFHVSETATRRRYSPGTVTALLLYVPLAIAASHHFVAAGEITLPWLLVALFGGVIAFNTFVSVPVRAEELVSGQRPPVSSSGMTARRSRTAPAPDVILPATRWAAVVVIPVLVLAFMVLYLMPDNNGPHFAWTVEPRMTAMMLGATYLTGVIYFATVLRARAWHEIRLGILPVSLFAGMLGITTMLHWPEFTHANPQFWMWTVLYFTLPFVLLVVWVRNERVAQPLPVVTGEVPVGRVTRVVLVLIGTGLGITTLLLFFAPSFMVSVWPWALSPLTARITAAELALFSFFALHVAADARWSQVRQLLRPQLASPLLFVGAIVASWGDFDLASPMAWAFFAFVLVVFVMGFPGLYFPGEARRRRQLEDGAGSRDVAFGSVSGQ